jgi:deazaflavin-dependent oxidoreductase (nitroreductase family)
MINQLSATDATGERVARALSRGHTIDITTIGRKSGQPRRIELVFHNIDGRVYISGLPGRRAWYANLVANPRFTFHLTGPVKADLRATARPVTEPVERKALMERVARDWRRDEQLEVMMRRSPLVEVTFDQAA